MKRQRLYVPNYMKHILKKHNIRMTKGLGQNFLIDGNIVESIVEDAGIGKDDYVLEIGPGIGTLTEELALRAKKVVSVEIDQTLIPVLDETLAPYDNVRVINEDILKVDIDKLIEEEFEGRPVKVVANLPYNITTPILANLIENKHKIESITVMIQKEVAERIVSDKDSKDYGALSVFINFYTEPEILFTVPNTVFIPRPKVESAVIKLELRDNIIDIDRDIFFRLVRSAFQKRRKTILNSMTSGEVNISKDELRPILEKLSIKENARAENLSIEDFANISREIEKLK